MDGNAAEKVWRRDTITADTEATLTAVRDTGLLTGAYLARGTGLALQFGHRRSLDLDFFVPELFNEEALLQRIQAMPDFSLVARAPHTLHATIGKTKVSFLGYTYPHPALFSNVSVAAPQDIACMKISAISSRGAKRDFIDLYAACGHFGLAELLALFARKYVQAHYSRVHILKSLTFFADAEKEPMPHMLVSTTWEEVKRFFRREALRFL